MKYLGMMAAVAGLLLQAGTAYAISFAPPRSVSMATIEDQGGRKPIGLTIGLSGSSWDQPSQAVDDPGLGRLGMIDFSSQVRPLVTAEYRINDTWSVGGWYNFISWDVAFSPVTAWAGLITADASVDGGIFEVHATYDFPTESRLGLSAQLGYQRTKYDGAGSVTVGGQTTFLAFDFESQQAVGWGLATYKIPAANESGIGFGLLGGLGLAQGIDSDSGATQGHALLGASVAFTPSISADASLWLTDVTRDDNRMARFTVGVTGRF